MVPAGTSVLDTAYRKGLLVNAVSSWEGIAYAWGDAPFLKSAGAEDYADLLFDEKAMAIAHKAQVVGPWPGHGAFRRDKFTGQLALHLIEDRQPDLMYIGFGETDEFGHRNDYSAYLDALSWADRFVGKLRELLIRLDKLDKTLIIITADHGRSRRFYDHGREPESAKVWLISNKKISLAGNRLANIAPIIAKSLSLDEKV